MVAQFGVCFWSLLLHSKNMHTRWIGNCQLTIGANVVWMVVCLQWGPEVNKQLVPGVTLPLTVWQLAQAPAEPPQERPWTQEEAGLLNVSMWNKFSLRLCDKEKTASCDSTSWEPLIGRQPENTQRSGSHYFPLFFLLPDLGSCSACSCPVSKYSTPTTAIYRLTCGHLLCRSCLHRLAPTTSNHVSCPACQSPSSRGDVSRVHLWPFRALKWLKCGRLHILRRSSAVTLWPRWTLSDEVRVSWQWWWC